MTHLCAGFETKRWAGHKTRQKQHISIVVWAITSIVDPVPDRYVIYSPFVSILYKYVGIVL